MKQFVRCSEAVAMGQEVQVQGLEVRRMACALLLRESQVIVTSALTWSTGFAFQNRY